MASNINLDSSFEVDSPPRIAATWNEQLKLWESDVGLFDSDNTNRSFGPAGPGGVCVAQAAGMAVSLCMTGRVVSLWAAPDLDDGSRSLLGCFVESASLDALTTPAEDGLSGSRDMRWVRIQPVSDRRSASQAVILADTLAHGDLDRDPPAKFLALAELAGLLASREVPAGPESALGSFKGVLQDADGLLGDERLTHTDLAWRAVDSHADLVDLASRSLSLKDLIQSAIQPTDGMAFGETGTETVNMLERFASDLKTAGQVTATAGAASATLQRPAPSAPVYTVMAPSNAAWDHNTFGGNSPVAVTSVEEKGPWRILRTDKAPEGTAEQLWVYGYGADGGLVGASRLMDQSGTPFATVAVGASVERWEIAGAPFKAERRWSVEAATRLARAAWFARKAGRAEAGRMWAGAAVALLAVGLVHRAGWAWGLSDKKVAGEMLDRLGAGHLVKALEAVELTGYLPVPDVLDALPAPLWAYLADFGDLAGEAQAHDRQPS